MGIRPGSGCGIVRPYGAGPAFYIVRTGVGREEASPLSPSSVTLANYIKKVDRPLIDSGPARLYRKVVNTYVMEVRYCVWWIE